jgi:beta-lactamase class A
MAPGTRPGANRTGGQGVRRRARAVARACAAGAIGVPLAAGLQACAAPSDPAPVTAASIPAITGPVSPASPATPSATRAKPSASASPLTRHESPFTEAAAAYVADRTGTVTAAVYDVATGQTWTFGSRKPQAEASIVKLNILEALYAQHRTGSGELPASDTSLAENMMEDSDNDAATSLWDAVGGSSQIASFNTSAGLTHTEPSSCVQCPGFPWPGWGLSTTTPSDQLALLRELIKPSTLLTDAQRTSALKLMEDVAPSQRWGVSGGVPSQATVALKDGWLPLNEASTNWQINSIGWISGRGRDYLMAVLTTGNPSEKYGIDTINQLSTLVWQHLG